jgi:hypothetical protein
MLERLKTSDAMAGLPCKSDIQVLNFKVEFKNQILNSKSEIENQISNFKIKSQIQNSNLVLPSGIDLANEVHDLRDLTERYWRIIQAQHVRIALLENDLRCVTIAKL